MRSDGVLTPRAVKLSTSGRKRARTQENSQIRSRKFRKINTNSMIEYTKDHPLRVIELFAGYGSQALALERLHRTFHDFCYKVVGFSEIDRYAIKAYRALHGKSAANLGDVTKIDWTKAPDCDLLTYSFPCQSVSSAGLQKGLTEGSGTTSSLLWECRRAITTKHPKYLLMENVAALLQKKFIGQFQKWTAFLESEGYNNFTKVLNARDYGVPQNRNRVFCVSIHDKAARYFFPKPFPLTRRLKDVLEDEVDEKFYLSDERVRGLIASTLKEKMKGRGFEFKPKSVDEETANTLTGSCVGRKTDNFMLIPNKFSGDLQYTQSEVSQALTAAKQRQEYVVVNGRQDIANAVTAHYAKEASADCAKNTYGGSFIMQKQQLHSTEPMKETITINPAAKDVAITIKSNYGRMSYANAVHNDPRKATFIMEKDIKQGDVIGSMQSNAYHGNTDGVSPTITAACGMGGGQLPMVVEQEPQVLRMERTEEEKQRRHAEGDKGAKFSAAKEMKPRTDGVANTITSATKDNLCVEGWRIRKLTPVETGRLMGLQDEEIKKMKDAGIPNTQLYKLHGNSIVVDVLFHIFRKMFVETASEEQQLTLF